MYTKKEKKVKKLKKNNNNTEIWKDITQILQSNMVKFWK